MPMSANDIISLVTASIPDAVVVMTDLAGDGDHWRAEITSESFRGKSRVEQHKMVYAALGDKMGGVLHALSVITKCPNSSV